MVPRCWRRLCVALLLGQAALGHVGGSQPAPCGAVGGREGSCDEDDVGLLQARRTSESSRLGASQGPPGPEFLALERLSDANLAELTGAGGTGLRVDAARWAEIFRELDADGDSVVQDADMIALNSSFALSHDNLSFSDYKHGLGLLVSMFPEFAQFIVEHEEVLLHLVTSDQPTPADAPLPPQEQMDLLQRRMRTQREALLQQHGEQLDHLDECQIKVLSFSWKALSFFLSFSGVSLEGLLGFEPPSGLAGKLGTSAFPGLVEKITEFAHSTNNPKEAAIKIWEVIKELWDSGFVGSTLQEAISGMGWWEWARTGVTLTATVAAHMATGSVLLIAQMTLTILSATGLFNAAQACEATCK